MVINVNSRMKLVMFVQCRMYMYIHYFCMCSNIVIYPGLWTWLIPPPPSLPPLLWYVGEGGPSYVSGQIK